MKTLITILFFVVSVNAQVSIGNLIIKKGYNEIFSDKTIIHQPWGAVGRVWIGQPGYIYPTKEIPALSDSSKAYWSVVFAEKLDWQNLHYIANSETLTFYGGTDAQILEDVADLLKILQVNPLGGVYKEDGKAVYEVEVK